MSNEEVLYKFGTEDGKVSLSLGNTKIGKMINWSTLPGNEDNVLIAKGRKLTNVTGTCSHNCNGCFKNCYARSSALQHHNSVIGPWARNTIMIRDHIEECFAEIDRQIRVINKKYYTTGKPEDLNYKFFRINVSGELNSLEELEHWNQLALDHPEIKFGIYTKNSEVIIPFFEKHGQTAENFTINISEWHGCMAATIAKLKAMGAKFNVFEYDDSNRSANDLTEEDVQRLSKLSHCPAVGATKENLHPINPATGTTWHCVDCKGCYTKTGTHRCVYSH